MRIRIEIEIPDVPGTVKPKKRVSIKQNTDVKNEDVFLIYPCVGGCEYRLSKDLVAEWKETYPAVDVAGQCREALAWLKADAKHLKTQSGMTRFLNAWLSRKQNQGVSNEQGQQTGFTAGARPGTDSGARVKTSRYTGVDRTFRPADDTDSDGGASSLFQRLGES